MYKLTKINISVKRANAFSKQNLLLQWKSKLCLLMAGVLFVHVYNTQF